MIEIRIGILVVHCWLWAMKQSCYVDCLQLIGISCFSCIQSNKGIVTMGQYLLNFQWESPEFPLSVGDNYAPHAWRPSLFVYIFSHDPTNLWECYPDGFPRQWPGNWEPWPEYSEAMVAASPPPIRPSPSYTPPGENYRFLPSSYFVL